MAADQPLGNDGNLSSLYIAKHSKPNKRSPTMTAPPNSHFHNQPANLIGNTLNMPSNYNFQLQLPERSPEATGPHTPNSLYNYSPNFYTREFSDEFESFANSLPLAQPWSMPTMPDSIIDAGHKSIMNMTAMGLGLFNFIPHTGTLPPIPPVIPSYSCLPISPSHPRPPPPSPQPPRQPLDPGTGYIPTVLSHSYRVIPGTSNEKVEGYITPSLYESRRFTCAYESCAEGFTGKLEAVREHVRKHLGISKLFECVSCPMTFTTLRAAKRHQETQMKKFVCEVCGQSFARLDYCRKHQQRCETRHGLLPNFENLNITGVEFEEFRGAA